MKFQASMWGDVLYWACRINKAVGFRGETDVTLWLADQAEIHYRTIDIKMRVEFGPGGDLADDIDWIEVADVIFDNYKKLCDDSGQAYYGTWDPRFQDWYKKISD